MKEFKNSIVSNRKLEPLFSLGDIYVSDFLKDNEKPKHNSCELKLGFDPRSKLVQLLNQPDKEAMWGSQYWYLSGTNESMKWALYDVAQKTLQCIPEEDNVFLDIASNDHTLLRQVPAYLKRIGIDPSDYSKYHIDSSIVNIKDFFSKKSFYKSGYKKARYITCCAVFYDLDNPNQFLQDVYEILEDDGVFVLQLSYTPLMLLQNEIGNIVHEHLGYYNLTSLKYVLEANNFVIRDFELNNVNGGSIRLYIQKDNFIDNFKSPSDKDISYIKINSLLEWEENNDYNSTARYWSFIKRIDGIKKRTIDFITKVKNEGKSVWGYGASTKANTMYQYFRLNNNLITKIAEAQERKVGLKTIGTNIPICSEKEMREFHPDYLLIGPWFFLETFKKREKEYLDKGGKFILTSPEFSIFSK